MIQIVGKDWKDNEEYIIQEYKKGRLQKDIAAEFTTANNTTVRRILIKNNIEFREYGSAWSKVDYNPFADLSDPTVMYWLGYLAADGCLHGNNKIDIATGIDPDHMKLYADWIGCGVNVNSYKDSRYADTYHHRVTFSSNEVTVFLKTLGFTKRKSCTLKMDIPITWEFLLGLSDGDGSIVQINKKYPKKRCKWTVATASPRFRDQIVDFLEKAGLHPTFTNLYNRKSGNTTYSININRKSEVVFLYNTFYLCTCPFLSRKKDKFGAFVSEMI